jgi:flagellar motor protein MotB
MSKVKKESFFWTSYSDLMTSLFFVMLVLFVLVIVLLHNKMKETEQERDATREQLNKIQEIEESVKNIDPTFFEYNTKYKRHTLKNINVSFPTGSSDINQLPNNQLEQLKEVGNTIVKFVDNAVGNNKDIKYMLIIEGQTSKDNYARNYELSYERALALHRFWRRDCDLIFDINTREVIISGSGQWSDFREEPDNQSNKKNQRFVIHIIPKHGIIESGGLDKQ